MLRLAKHNYLTYVGKEGGGGGCLLGLGSVFAYVIERGELPAGAANLRLERMVHKPGAAGTLEERRQRYDARINELICED